MEGPRGGASLGPARRVGFASRASRRAPVARRTGRYTSWCGDDEGDLGRVNNERLILASDHPGAITHLWSANPSGRLRVYLDDDARPRIDVDLAQLLAGDVAPFVPSSTARRSTSTRARAR